MRNDIEKINKQANERDIDLQERVNKIDEHKRKPSWRFVTRSERGEKRRS